MAACGDAARSLAHALVDQHVGVDGHAQRQRDGGDAGQGQRGLQHRQHGHQQQQVDRQRDRGEHAEQHVVQHMKTAMATKPHITLWKPLAMFSAPRLGPMVRSSMISIGAASEPARSSSAVSLASTVVMRPEICTRAADLGLDHRRRHDLALALLEQQDGHALADVLA
jgi:hypothetical protein